MARAHGKKAGGTGSTFVLLFQDYSTSEFPISFGFLMAGYSGSWRFESPLATVACEIFTPGSAAYMTHGHGSFVAVSTGHAVENETVPLQTKEGAEMSRVRVRN